MGITEEHIERIKKHAETMEGFAVAAVNVSSELDAVLRDNQQMKRQIERLNEANDRLRERLNRSENHDGSMKLPLDADGVPIRIGDEMDIDGEIAVVKGYQVSHKCDELQFIAVTEGYRKTFTLFGKNRKHFKHVAMSADSWEKLEEDVSVGAQDYCANWLGIDIRKTLTSDDDRAFAKDVIRRAKKLAGIEQEAQR